MLRVLLNSEYEDTFAIDVKNYFQIVKVDGNRLITFRFFSRVEFTVVFK